MASFGSCDLGLANAPEGLLESTPCGSCGHALEDHIDGKICIILGAHQRRLGSPFRTMCPCTAFQEPGEPELDGFALSQAVERLRERDW